MAETIIPYIRTVAIAFVVFLFIFLILYRFYRGLKESSSPSSLRQRDHNRIGKTRRHPVVAAIFSFIIPGLGQFYNGDVSKGVTNVIFFTIALFVLIGGIVGDIPVFSLIISLIGFLSVIIIYLSAIFDAYGSAVNINKSLESILKEGMKKKCPYCAEMIKKEATVCRYCTRTLKEPDQQIETTKS